MNHAAIRFHDEHPGVSSLRDEVLRGLAAQPKAIPPKFFYDERGSKLFDRICEQPEYYPTRTEIGILDQCAADIAALAGPGTVLVELGSGASRKVRLLLDALRPAAYVGVDISRDFLLHSTARLAQDYPWLPVHACCADFSRGLSLPALEPDARRKLAFYPGSSIGNFEPAAAGAFLRQLRRMLLPDGALLIGVDLKKDPAVLDAAYNDAGGVTAEFNLNLLHRIRRELDAALDVGAFRHRAFYNAAQGRVEMHLRSDRDQEIRINGRRFCLRTGETIHTENSYKYALEEFRRLAGQAGFRPLQAWTDPRELFSVHYLAVEPAPHAAER
ncbi:MAG: L-histidine N(alpha)-methyltransferase [Gammaproteobacteria bacterium]